MLLQREFASGIEDTIIVIREKETRLTSSGTRVCDCPHLRLTAQIRSSLSSCPWKKTVFHDHEKTFSSPPTVPVYHISY